MTKYKKYFIFSIILYIIIVHLLIISKSIFILIIQGWGQMIKIIRIKTFGLIKLLNTLKTVIKQI